MRENYELSLLDELKDLTAISEQLNKQQKTFIADYQQVVAALKNAQSETEIIDLEKKLNELEHRLTVVYAMRKEGLKTIGHINCLRADSAVAAHDIERQTKKDIERIEGIENEITAASKRLRRSAKELATINIEQQNNKKGEIK